MRYISLVDGSPLLPAAKPTPVLTLYCVTTQGREWSKRYWVRAEDGGKAIRYVRNRDQEFYNSESVQFYVEKQDDSKGVVFG